MVEETSSTTLANMVYLQRKNASLLTGIWNSVKLFKTESCVKAVLMGTKMHHAQDGKGLLVLNERYYSREERAKI